MKKELLTAIGQLSQEFSTDQETLQEAQHIITDTLMKIGEQAEQQELIRQLKLSDGSDLAVLKKIIRQFHAERKQVAQSARSNVAKTI